MLSRKSKKSSSTGLSSFFSKTRDALSHNTNNNNSNNNNKPSSQPQSSSQHTSNSQPQPQQQQQSLSPSLLPSSASAVCSSCSSSPQPQSLPLPLLNTTSTINNNNNSNNTSTSPATSPAFSPPAFSPPASPTFQQNPSAQRFWRRGRRRSMHGSVINLKPTWFSRNNKSNNQSSSSLQQPPSPLPPHSSQHQAQLQSQQQLQPHQQLTCSSSGTSSNPTFSRSADDLSHVYNNSWSGKPSSIMASSVPRKKPSAFSISSFRESWVKISDEDVGDNDGTLSSFTHRSRKMSNKCTPVFGVPISTLVLSSASTTSSLSLSSAPLHPSSTRLGGPKSSAVSSTSSSLNHPKTGAPAPVPIIVDRCLSEIESRGLDEEGLYRVSGTKTTVDRLKKLFNTTNPIQVDISRTDVPDLASLLKLWFRELPEPVIPFHLYDEFIALARVPKVDDRVNLLGPALSRLPKPNLALLHRLVVHLSCVSERAHKNSMTAQNLAVIFAPTLLQPKTSPDSFAVSMGNLGLASQLLVTLLGHKEDIFQRGPPLTLTASESMPLPTSTRNFSGAPPPQIHLQQSHQAQHRVRGSTVPPSQSVDIDQSSTEMIRSTTSTTIGTTSSGATSSIVANTGLPTSSATTVGGTRKGASRFHERRRSMSLPASLYILQSQGSSPGGDEIAPQVPPKDIVVPLSAVGGIKLRKGDPGYNRDATEEDGDGFERTEKENIIEKMNEEKETTSNEIASTTITTTAVTSATLPASSQLAASLSINGFNYDSSSIVEAKGQVRKTWSPSTTLSWGMIESNAMKKSRSSYHQMSSSVSSPLLGTAKSTNNLSHHLNNKTINASSSYKSGSSSARASLCRTGNSSPIGACAGDQQQSSSRPASSIFFDRINEMRCSDDSISGDRPLSFHSALSAH